MRKSCAKPSCKFCQSFLGAGPGKAAKVPGIIVRALAILGTAKVAWELVVPTEAQICAQDNVFQKAKVLAGKHYQHGRIDNSDANNFVDAIEAYLRARGADEEHIYLIKLRLMAEVEELGGWM